MGILASLNRYLPIWDIWYPSIQASFVQLTISKSIKLIIIIIILFLHFNCLHAGFMLWVIVHACVCVVCLLFQN